MTFKPLRLVGLAVVVLLLLGSGLFLFLRESMPQLLQTQLERQLADYGVNRVDLGRISADHTELWVEYFVLHGQRDGLRFDIRGEQLRLAYDWRSLRNLRVDAVVMRTLRVEALGELTADQQAQTAGAVSMLALSSWLPRVLLQEIPSDELLINEFSLSYDEGGENALLTTGSLQASDDVAVRMESHWAGSVLEMRADVTSTSPLSLRLNWLRGEQQLLGLSTSLVSPVSDNWQWLLNGELDAGSIMLWLKEAAPLALREPLPEDLSLAGKIQLDGSVEHPAQFSLQPGWSSQMEFDVSLQAVLNSLDWKPMLQALTGDFQMRLSGRGTDYQIRVEDLDLRAQLQSESLALDEKARAWLRWDTAVPVRWLNAGSLLVESREGAWMLVSDGNELVLGTGDSVVQLRQFELEMEVSDPDQPWPVGKLNTRIDTRLRKKSLPQLKLSGQSSGEWQAAGLELKIVDVAESLALDLTSELQLPAKTARSRVALQTHNMDYISSAWLPLLQEFGLVGESLQLDTGRMALVSNLFYGPAGLENSTVKSQLAIADLSGRYGEYRFVGLNSRIELAGFERIQTLQPATLELDSVFAGFDVVDVQASLSLPQPTALAAPTVNIEQFSCGIFAGRVFLAEPVRWDFNAPSNALTLQAADLSLADMVAMQQGQDIRADGLLEGKLPVIVSNGRILIGKGYLQARAPGGSIRYLANESSSALAQSNSELSLALDLLRDFRYRTLASRVELDEAGNLLLQLSLAGNNPAQFDGRAVEFNINLEQNLDPLLQSLRLSDKLVEELERQAH